MASRSLSGNLHSEYCLIHQSIKVRIGAAKSPSDVVTNKRTKNSQSTKSANSWRNASVECGCESLTRIYGKARISISPKFNCSASRATLRKLSAASVRAT